MDDDCGYPYLLGNPHMEFPIQLYRESTSYSCQRVSSASAVGISSTESKPADIFVDKLMWKTNAFPSNMTSAGCPASMLVYWRLLPFLISHLFQQISAHEEYTEIFRIVSICLYAILFVFFHISFDVSCFSRFLSIEIYQYIYIYRYSYTNIYQQIYQYIPIDIPLYTYIYIITNIVIPIHVNIQNYIHTNPTYNHVYIQIYI